jgi:hypothetical protein
MQAVDVVTPSERGAAQQRSALLAAFGTVSRSKENATKA